MNGVFDDLYQVAEEYLNPIVRDPANRGRSWDQCYTFFQQYRLQDQADRQANQKLACLHLGFYLASWGMFRGSGCLLQKDYTIYAGIIEILLAQKYNGLWQPDFFGNLLADGEEIDEGQVQLIFQLKDQIENYVNGLPIIRSPNAQEENTNCTDTITSKILLGTLACTPAYDQYFGRGLVASGITRCGSFTSGCFARLLNICRERGLWQQLQEQPIVCHEVAYPVMRVVDLYFWNFWEKGIQC